ncbi:hypothetical protein ABFS82_09G072700 [Erythranthe guttata]|uniref:extra-large guanine nucleotide-binding protein 3-like n=1 Tax=Erythranthe guttata TaxID=4155 RepID=UPI00064D9B47|nr:PREDICTED: extra-large guanine nucleotide-binding protein 3-like [Erythranthe guttata]|eukprot:XP_012856185.1 PREDICTED: extra-large guanine nucleotide-binding protein 3-like [Erythranthe guttata]
MAAAEPPEQEPATPNLWAELLRKMLPEGAPLPDDDQLDYSISVNYAGPPPFYNPPPLNSTFPKPKFTTFPKYPPSLSPRNPASSKSASSSDTTTTSDNYIKLLSAASSIASDDGGAASDPGNSPRSDQVTTETKHVKRGIKSRRCRRCSRCRNRGKGILWGKEGCVVCGAEYCKKCLLKAMGSMPEGRKCITCIGNPIDEANRAKLGKPSRLLKRICSQLGVKQIMEMERECRANQVMPRQIIVNGRELREDELDELLGCKLPPKGLKPGRFWYDEDSGLWGKEGEKPERIISSKLDVGGKLQTGASGGNTRVYMNGREITKLELRVLKLAKVQCPSGTHFWLYEDGSYEEEGQNNIKGNIWEKVSVRFISSLFSLPVPPPSQIANPKKKDRVSVIPRLFSPDYSEQNRVRKLLLLGLDGSGKSTIYKQAKLIYANKFSSEEMQKIKHVIQSNMYRYLGTLLEWREHIEEESFDRSVRGEMEFNNQKISDFSDWLLNLMANGEIDIYFPAAAREYSPLVHGIWKDPSIQETYKRVKQLQLIPDVAEYFLNRVIEISRNEYEPLEEDILLAEGTTPSNGIACTEFSFEYHSAVSQIYDENPKIQQTKYQLIQLSSKGQNRTFKWLEMFENTSAVIFCISLIDYDQHDKMIESRDFFKAIATHSCFVGSPFLLLLTKYDLFEDKIEKVPLTVCDWFRDFKPLKTRNHSSKSPLAQQAFYYIGMKFKKMYTSLTGKKLYVNQIQARDRKSVDEAFRYIREIIDWEEQQREDEGIYYTLSDDDM